MSDISKFQSEFLKQKKEYLDYLKSVDYGGIASKVSDAISSGLAEKLTETRTWLASTYDAAVLKDRSNEARVDFMDTEIDSFVENYTKIQNTLDGAILVYLKNSVSDFMQEHSLRTPNIANLRSISENYAVFQKIRNDLDQLIMNYSKFSNELKQVELKTGSIIAEYNELTDINQLNNIRKGISGCKKELADIKSSTLVKKNHPAYDYRNTNLDKLDSELGMFEKEGFVGKKKEAERQMKIASDLIELLECASKDDLYDVLEEASRQRFSDYRAFEATLYLGDVAKDHAEVVKELKKESASHASRHQSSEVQNLNKAINDALVKSKQPDELKAQKVKISNDYSGKADVLCQLSSQDALRQALNSGLASIDALVKDRLDAAERERQHEIAKKKLETDETNKVLASKLAYCEKEKKRHEETVDALIENVGKLTPLIQETQGDSSKARDHQINKQFTDIENLLRSAGLSKLHQEFQDLKKAVEQRYKPGADESRIKTMLDAAVKTLGDEIKKDYDQKHKQGADEARIKPMIDAAVKVLDDKLSKLCEQVQKKEEPAAVKNIAVEPEQISKCAMAEQMGALNTQRPPRRLSYEANIPKEPVEQKKLNYAVPTNPTNEEIRNNALENSQPQIHIGTYIGTMNADTVNMGNIGQKAEKRRDVGTFDLAYELQGRLPPKNTALNNIVRRITGNENMNMAERLLSIDEYLGQSTPAVTDRKDLGWLKWFREKCVDEINFGTVGDFIRNQGFVKEQFYGIVKNVIDPYIAKCEKTLSAAAVH